jgi:8-oxo-dGTP diphosphatase
MTPIKLFVAGKAFIEHNGTILVLREAGKYMDGVHAGEYDVVGGRIEPGERVVDALTRETKEETGLDITVGKPFFVNEWQPVVRGEQWHIVGIFFQCTAHTDAVTLSQDHDDYQWIDPKDYKNQHIIENMYPVFEAYLTEKSHEQH